MRLFGLFLASIFVLVPAFALLGAFIGDAITPDVPVSEITDEQLDRWGGIVHWVIILQHIFPAPLLLGTVMIALINWHEGYATWPTWVCLVVGSVCGLFIFHPFGILFTLVCLVILIAANSSRWLAPWK